MRDLFERYVRNQISHPPSLRRYLMSLFGITVLVILLVLTFNVAFFTYQTEENGWRSRQGEAALNAGESVASFIEYTEEALCLFDVLGKDEIKHDPTLLHRALDLNSALNEVVYLDARGQVIANTFQDQPLLANLFTIPQSRWFQSARAGKHYQSNIQLASNDEPYLIIAIPGTDSSVIAARLKMQVLWDVVDRIRVGATGHVYVANRDGQLMAHSDRQVLLKQPDVRDRPEHRAMFGMTGTTWFGTYINLSDVSVVAASTKIPGTEWIVVVEMARDEAFSASRNILVTVGSSTLIIVVMLMWIVRRTLERALFAPVERLRAGANRIGQGDLQYQIRITSQDEIGMVTEAFNRMSQNLREREAQLAAQNKALEQNQARLSRIADNMNDIITEIDAEGNISYASPSHLWVLGTDPQAQIGRSILEGLHPDDALAAIETLGQALSDPSQTTHLVTFRYRHNNGHYLWMECIGNLIKDSQGQIEGIILSSRNVTERKQIEEKVRQQNQYLIALHQTALNLLNRLDSENILADIVERAAQLIGTSDGYIYLAGATAETIEVKVGTGAYSRFLGYQMHIGEGVAGRVWQTGEPLVVDDYDSWDGRSPSFPKDVFQSVVGVPLKMGSRVVGVLGLSYSSPNRKFHDSDVQLIIGFAQLASIALDNSQLYSAAEREIQERKHTEKALRESETRYRLIAEHASDLIWMRDMNLRLTYLSPAIEKLRGYTVNEGMMQSIAEIMTPDSVQAAVTFFTDILAEAETVSAELLQNESRMLESELICKDGKTIWAESSMKFLLDEENKPYGIVGVTRDISERKNAETKLRQLNDQLENRVSERTVELAEINEQLEREVVERKRLADRQTILYEVLRAVSEELDQNAVARIAADKIAGMTGWSHVCVVVPDAMHECWVVQGASGTLAAEIGASRPITHGVVGRVFRTGQSQIVADVSIDPDYVLEASSPLKSELAIPLLHGGQLFGVLNIESERINAFDANDIALTSVLAEAIALALSNAQLYEATQHELLERRRAEEALSASEAKYRLDFENVADVIYSFDLGLRIISVSPSAEKVLGYSPAELVGKVFTELDLLAPEYFELALSDTLKVFSGERAQSEYAFIAKDGTRKFGEVTGAPLRSQDGEIIGVVSVARDITERKRAEEMLLKFKLGIERSADAIFITDPQGAIVYTNPSFEKIYGFTQAEAVGHTPRILKSGVVPPEQYQQFWATLLNKSIAAGEIINKTKDGRLITIESSNNPILDVGGNIIGFLGVHRDITERKRLQDLLQLRLRLIDIATTQSLESLLQATLDEIGELTNSPIGFYHFVEADQKIISLQAWSTKTRANFCKVDGKGLHYSIDQAGVWTDCIRARRPVIHNDYPSLPHRKGMPEGHAQVVRELVVPILRQDCVVAILGVGNKPQDYTERDVELVSYVADVAWEIAQRKRAEHALRESEERYALAAHGANDGLWDWDLMSNLVYYSPRWKEMVGHNENEIDDSPSAWFKRIHPGDLTQLETELHAHLDGKKPHMESEYRILHSDGHYRWMLCRGLGVRDANGHALRIAGSQTDISRRKAAEERLIHDALHESLTGLPNRTLFLDRVAQTLRATKRDIQYLSAVLFLDLDRFKVINDSLGHQVGDLLLVEMARRLELCVRPTDTVARFGGDEFAILLNGIKGPADATQTAERVQRDLTMPFIIQGHNLMVSASIGVALINGTRADFGQYENPEEVMRDADVAMYRAKALGKARHEVFDTGLHFNAVNLLQLETELRNAIEHDELRVYYQPIVGVANGSVVSIEALVRWQHPERGLIPPSEFIPIAEESGLIVPMGEWVLRTACAQIANWRATGFPNLEVAVNFSARQFQDPRLATLVSQVLAEYHLPGHALELEITESTAMRDVDQTLRTLDLLDQMGVQISIDDFGNSYSALGYLKQFPFRILKIDRSFLHNIMKDANNAAITTAIIAMARTLKLRVIAEGVETPDQLEFLLSHKCDEMQGFLFSHPAPADTISRLLHSKITVEAYARAKTQIRKNGNGRP